MEVIKEGQTVLLQKEKVLKAVKVERGRKIVFEKLHFKFDQAIGKPLGSWFEVSGNQLHEMGSPLDKPGNTEGLPGEGENSESGVDNRQLMDEHGKSQSLKREEIIEMKAKGTKGDEIVQTIVNNSASFNDKTVYSQKKYLKKKKQKHLTNIKIIKPCARLLCKMYECREPAKICHLRIDTISQMLTMANIHHGSKVAVVETCSGLLLGVILERLGGCGSVINLHSGETPSNFHAVTHFNFPEHYWTILHSLPLSKIGPMLADKSFEESVGELPNMENDPMEVNGVQKTEDITPLKPDNDQNQMEWTEIKGPNLNKGKKTILTEEEKCAIRLKRKNKRLTHQYCAWKALKAKDLDALVVACKYHPTPLVLSLLECVAPSRPFVVYCESREPLMELFVQLSMSSKAINVKISETFMRYYQVLPEQTHPRVMMNTSGGYLLTGISAVSREHCSKRTSCDNDIPCKKSKIEL